MRWDRQNLRIRYSGVRYSGVCFHIFFCNSPELSNVVRYNGVFVIAGFVIAGFVIAGFVIAGFVSTYFAVILPSFQMLFVIAGFVMAGSCCR